MLWRVSAEESVLSARSARVRDARQLTVAKFRRLRGLFLAEGPQAVREALTAGMVVEIFVDEDWVDRRDEVIAASNASGVALHVIEAAGFVGLASAQTPRESSRSVAGSPVRWLTSPRSTAPARSCSPTRCPTRATPAP